MFLGKNPLCVANRDIYIYIHIKLLFKNFQNTNLRFVIKIIVTKFDTLTVRTEKFAILITYNLSVEFSEAWEAIQDINMAKESSLIMILRTCRIRNNFKFYHFYIQLVFCKNHQLHWSQQLHVESSSLFLMKSAAATEVTSFNWSRLLLPHCMKP